MLHRQLRLAALLAALALVGAACGDNNSSSKAAKEKERNAPAENASNPAPNNMPGGAGGGGEEMMPLPPGAENMKVAITSPASGTKVTSNAVTLKVAATGYQGTCDLPGKPGVAGYGHWHVNADSSTGPMMGMGPMFGMTCARVFHATTDGLKSGDKHSIIALLVDNGHAPLMPANEDKVEVTIG